MVAVLKDETPPESGSAPARVVREERTYEAWKRESWFADLARAQVRNEPGAWERLYRNERELEVRSGATSRSGSAPDFTPPQWIISEFQTVARAGRTLGDLVQNLPLPAGVSSVDVPKMTTGAGTTVQAGQNAPSQSVDQVTADAGGANNIVTIAGEVNASLQLFEQTPANPGYDYIVYRDLNLDYNQTLEQQMLAGTGSSNGQLTGVTKVSGIASISGSGVSNSTGNVGSPALNFSLVAANDVNIIGVDHVTSLWTFMGQAAAAVGNNRQLPPDVIIMAPRRYFAIAAARDLQGRPLGSVGLLPNVTSLPHAGEAPPVDRLLGLNTYLSGGIIGTNSSTADYIIVARVGDMVLYESAPKWSVNMNPLAGTLGVKLSLHRYCAFLNFKPSSIAVVTNITPPTNF